MTNRQLESVFAKTSGHCHFCGDRLVFERRGWHEGNQRGYWEVDHVIQRAKGGRREAENCLPACTRCNRLRWHRTGAAVRELLLLGILARNEIRCGSVAGHRLEELRTARLGANVARRTRRRNLRNR